MNSTAAMEVVFQPSRGSPFLMELGYFDTVLEIKHKIEKAKAIPTSKQTLIFNGAVLHDHLNVHDSDILDRSRIHLLLPPDPNPPPPTSAAAAAASKIQLLLRLPSSKARAALEADPSETVLALKARIHDMEGIPPGRLAVVHAASGAELPDHRPLGECGLADGSEVAVAVPARMGIFVVTKSGGGERVPVEVGSTDSVGELRRKLEKMRVDLPPEGYFFIYKQNVMEDDRSFRWHQVGPGDAIEIFGGSVSAGS
ncbi:Ubiquitin-like superfamily protein [Striga hermonthica]|uniref:Ubiquitin-like superfamily protein n=1 Tax=Striga hermonthica TaxID=68872 RepID=A0A9N7N961_STRHE|nr:Ubiquitin-like superfamily protein [Striga hermonthica]